jgi:hypothetical protein
MGFYGKVINYLSKAFSKIKINNKTLQATSYDEVLEMNGDNWIVLEAADKGNIISYSHANAQSKNTSSVDIVNIKGTDLTDTVTFTILSPEFDEKGHYSKTTQNNVTLNISKEIQDRLEEDQEIWKAITEKEEDRQKEDEELWKALVKETEERIKTDKELDKRIGEASITGEQEASGVYIPIEQNAADIVDLDLRVGSASYGSKEASGVYIPIEQNTDLIGKLDERIGKPSNSEANEAASGAYIPIEENAANI